MEKEIGNRVKNLVENKTFLFILIVMSVAVVTAVIRNILSDIYGSTLEKSFVIKAVSDILVSLLIVLPVIKKIGAKERIGLCSKKGIGKGLLLGSIDLIVMTIFMYIILLEVQKAQYQYAGLGMLFSIILWGFATGIMEEFGIRGILLPVLIQKWGDDRKATINSVFMTSLVFASLHSIDFISVFIKNGFLSKEYIVAKIFHIISTFMFGVFAGALVVYTKNIWSIVIIHALHNIILSIDYIFVTTWVAQRLNIIKGIRLLTGTDSFLTSKYMDVIYPCIFSIPTFCVGLILLKRYKEKE